MENAFQPAVPVEKYQLQAEISQLPSGGQLIVHGKAACVAVLVEPHLVVILILGLKTAGHAVLVKGVEIIHLQCALDTFPDCLRVVKLHFVHAGGQILIALLVEDMENVLHRLNGLFSVLLCQIKPPPRR